MYDSIDGKQASVLKNVNTTDFDSIPVTINVARSWQYVQAPEFKEPVIINSPRYSPVAINPDYLKLAQIAYDTVLRTMIEGEKEHQKNEWQEVPVKDHVNHIREHGDDCYIDLIYEQKSAEDHIAHAMTRCAMIKFLEK
jgi:hypothetical protein